MASSGHSVSTSDDATTADVGTCPLCAEPAPEFEDIYRHLMVNHRKSELSRLVLTFAENHETSVNRSDE